MESLFEKLGGTYTLAEDGMYYPAISIPKSDLPRYGKYGRLCYLQEHRFLVYHDLVLHVKLTEHLNEIDETANARMEFLIRQMQEQQGINEELKARDQLTWAGTMNNIRAVAEEIVCDLTTTQQGTLYKISPNSNLMYLPLFYKLPKELVSRQPAYLKLPRKVREVLSTEEAANLMNSDKFLELVWDCYVWAIWQCLQVPDQKGNYRPIPGK